MLRIKLVRSPIGHTPKNRATIEALGLRKVNQVREMADTPAHRGMVIRVKEMLEIDVPEGTPAIPDSRSIPRAKRRRQQGTTPPGNHRKH